MEKIAATAALAFAGGATGSFLACAAYRVPRGISLWRESRCDSCGRKVGIWVFLPLVAWPLLKGRCRYCGSRIPVRYWLAEVLAAAVVTPLAAKGVNLWTIAFAIVGWWLLYRRLLAAERKSVNQRPERGV